MFQTIDEIIATGLRVSTINEDDALPDFEDAAEKYMIPFTGAEMYKQLKLYYQNPDEQSDIMDELLALFRRPLAAFAYLNELPATHVRITSAGVRRTSTDNMPTAYRWEYEEARNYLSERGYSTLESLLNWIDEHSDDEEIEPLLGATFTDRANLIIKSGEQLSQLITVQYPYSMWRRLLPIIKDFTRQQLIPTFGQEFYAEVLAETQDADTIALREMWQLSAANIAIANAAGKLAIDFGPAGFTIAGQSANVQAPGAQPADMDRVKKMQAFAKADGNMYLRKAINTANAQASQSKWQSYYNSPKYTAPGSKLIDRKNDKRKTFRM